MSLPTDLWDFVAHLTRQVQAQDAVNDTVHPRLKRFLIQRGSDPGAFMESMVESATKFYAMLNPDNRDGAGELVSPVEAAVARGIATVLMKIIAEVGPTDSYHLTLDRHGTPHVDIPLRTLGKMLERASILSMAATYYIDTERSALPGITQLLYGAICEAEEAGLATPGMIEARERFDAIMRDDDVENDDYPF